MEKIYKTEQEFLNDYDSSIFSKLSMTADILLFSVSSKEHENYRKLNEKYFSILLVKRENFPFKDKWCLPGGFLNPDETLDEASMRILENETNLKDVYLEQLYTFSEPKRDPRMRIVSSAYMALVDKNRLKNKLKDQASWFTIHVLEEKNEIQLTFDNGTTSFSIQLRKVLKDKTTNQYIYEVIKNNDIAFDHATVIAYGIERLKNKTEYTDIVFNMMPEYFTLGELQQVYEVILDKKLLDPAFRRMIKNKVEKTDQMKTGEGHRPSVLYRYKNQ